MQFNRAVNLSKKLFKHRLLFHLVLIINCNVKITHKRSSVLNLIYSGQQFSYIYDNEITSLIDIYFLRISFIPSNILDTLSDVLESDHPYR